MPEDKKGDMVLSQAPSEHSALIKKQLAVAGDIQLLSGNQLNQDEAMLLSSMYQSEYFKSVDSLSKAITRVVFGKMIGIDVATALTSLYIIDGKPALEAKAIRNTLNMAGYDIVVKELSDKKCVLSWAFQGKHLGESSFTMKEAMMRGYVDAKCFALADFPEKHQDDQDIKKYNKYEKRWETLKGCHCKDNWKSMPQEMLVARATSKGNTMYGNKAFKQEVYDVDEIIESPFREDTTPVEIAKAEIKKAKNIDKLQDITKGLQPDELEKLLPDISARTKELLEDAGTKSKADSSPSPAKN